jgi:hypothetical protein
MKTSLAVVAISLVLPLAACDSNGLADKPPTAGSSAGSEARTAGAEGSDTPTPAPTKQVEPQSYRGHGDKILRIKDGKEVWLATFTHAGSSNFIVSTLDSSGGEGEGLVNAIGRYKGTVLFNIEEGTFTRALKIQADGAWTVRLERPTDSRRWHGARIAGKGDDVLALDEPTSGLVTAKLTHTGSANFIVDAYTENGSDNLVNEIGRYTGEVMLPNGTYLITVHADGGWTLAKS